MRRGGVIICDCIREAEERVREERLYLGKVDIEFIGKPSRFKNNRNRIGLSGQSELVFTSSKRMGDVDNIRM